MTRLFPDGEPIEVRLSADSQPAAIYWRGGWHTVELVCNRWRIKQDWWQMGGGEGTNREYWKVAIADGVLLTIYRELKGNEWKLSRVYD